MPRPPDATDAALEGRIADETGAPLPDLLVLDADTPPRERHDAPRARTDAQGRFALAPPPARGRVAVYDALGIRRLLEHDARDAPEAVVPRTEAEGWLATGGAKRPPRLSHGNAWEPLVDNARAFEAMGASVMRARKSVWLSQLFFDTQMQSEYPRGLPPPEREGAAPGGRLAEAVRAVAERGVQVRVLINENTLVPDDVDELLSFFSSPHVKVRAGRRNPGVLHTKLLLVDGEEAFVIGSPFQQRYWDTRQHLAHELRRGKRRPHHDVSLRLRGPVVADLAREFARLWRTSLGHEPAEALDLPAPPAPAGDLTLQVVVTSPDLARRAHPRLLDAARANPFASIPRWIDRFVGGPSAHRELDAPLVQEGEWTLLESYARALARARRFVYAENQYFTAEVAARMLSRALDARPRLEVILVLNEHMDIPGYDGAQMELLEELQARHPERLGVFSMWTARAARGAHGEPGVRRVYMHSKVTIVDDVWASVGTANLDGASLDAANELGLPDVRNEELNVVHVDGVAGAPRTGAVSALRVDLWSEQLGLEAARLRDPPPEGWLALWREVAQENLRRVRTGSLDARGFVLPYAPDLPEQGLRVR